MQIPSRKLFGSTGHAAAAHAAGALVAVLASPLVVAGQTISSRPASVALTVVVPGRAPSAAAFATATNATVVSRSANVADIETLVGVGEGLTSRVEVRLGRDWPSDSPRVWIRNSSGTFERLVAGVPVVAHDASSVGAAVGAAPRPAVMLRIESDRPLPALLVPVEYRLKIGSGDQASVWTIESPIRLEAVR
jgi:hypothetical protein